MTCNNCRNKPVARGIKNIRCVGCRKDTVVNFSSTGHLCGKCSYEKRKCVICGAKLEHTQNESEE